MRYLLGDRHWPALAAVGCLAIYAGSSIVAEPRGAAQEQPAAPAVSRAVSNSPALALTPVARPTVSEAPPVEADASSVAPPLAIDNRGDVSPADNAMIDAWIHEAVNSPSGVSHAQMAAWILATHPDPRLRDPELAQAIARRLLQYQSNFETLGALAAACGASGQYAEASQLMQEALQEAHVRPEERVAECRHALIQFRSGAAYLASGQSVAARLDSRAVRVAYALALVGEQLSAEASGLAIFAWETALQFDANCRPALLGAAVALCQAGQLASAEQRFITALASHPNDPDTLVALGAVQLDQGKLAEAAASYQQALALRPQWPKLANDLAWLLATHADSSGHEDALRLAEAACAQLDAPDVNSLDTLAAAYAAVGRYAEAEATVRRALDLAAEQSPSFCEPLRQRLDLYTRRLPPWRPREDRLARAAELAQQGQFDLAADELAIVLGSNQRDAEVLVQMAALRMRQGQVREALDHYAHALLLRPDWTAVRNDMAWVLATHPSARKPEMALKLALETCQHTNYEDATCLDTLAAAHAAAGDFVEATRCAQQALQLCETPSSGGDCDLVRRLSRRLAIYQLQHPFDDAEDAPTLLELAAVRLAEGRLAEGLAHYESLAARYPAEREYRNDLAWLLATCRDGSLRDPARALALAEANCKEVQKLHPNYLDTLAAAYAAVGRFDEAIRTAQQALQSLRSVSGEALLVAPLERRLTCYRAGQPFVEEK